MVSSFLHVSLSFPPLLNPAHSYTRSKHAILICIEKFAPCASRLNLKRFFWDAGAGKAEDNLTCRATVICLHCHQTVLQLEITKKLPDGIGTVTFCLPLKTYTVAVFLLLFSFFRFRVN